MSLVLKSFIWNNTEAFVKHVKRHPTFPPPYRPDSKWYGVFFYIFPHVSFLFIPFFFLITLRHSCNTFYLTFHIVSSIFNLNVLAPQTHISRDYCRNRHRNGWIRNIIRHMYTARSCYRSNIHVSTTLLS